MRSIPIVLVSLTLLIQCGFSDKTINNALDEYFEKARSKHNIPGISVGIVKDGKLTFAKGYGKRSESANVTADTLFRIGSCTKAFTAFALGILVDEGKINWDDPIIRHVPEFKFNDDYATKTLTIRDALAHRTGLPRHDMLWYMSNYTRNDLLRKLPHLASKNGIREKYIYNNLMYGVAGIVIERVSGMSYEKFVDTRILKPLGMKRSVFTVRDMKLDKNHAVPYVSDGKGNKMVPRNRNTETDMIGAAGNIILSVVEMAKWINLQLSLYNETNNSSDISPYTKLQSLIRKKTLKEMHTPQIIMDTDESKFNGYGLAWVIEFGKRGHEVIVSHNGFIDNYVSAVNIFPKKKVGVVIMMNGGASDAISTMAYDVVDIIQGKALNESAEETVSQNKTEQSQSASESPKFEPIDNFNDYIGIYDNEAYGSFMVRYFKNETSFLLTITYNDIKCALSRLDDRMPDVFVAKSLDADLSDYEIEVEFARDRWRDVSELRANLEPTVQYVVFKKRVPEKFFDKNYLNKFVGIYCNVTINSKIQVIVNEETNQLEASVMQLKSNSVLLEIGLLKPWKLNIFVPMSLLDDKFMFEFNTSKKLLYTTQDTKKYVLESCSNS